MSVLDWLGLGPVKPAPASRESRQQAVVVAGRTLQVTWVRDRRCKRLRLVVDERGARLTRPWRTSAATAERFLHDNAAWLLGQLDALDADQPAAAAGLEKGVTAQLPLQGREREVVWLPARATRVLEQDGQLQFHCSAQAGQAALARALAEFYEARARAVVGPQVAFWLPGLPRAPRRFVFKQMSSRWGSLAPDGTVCLDLSLVLAPPAALEYVLVHELCHLIQANHSPAFWAEVEARLPHWQGQRQWLAEHGRALKYRLRQLLAVA